MSEGLKNYIVISGSILLILLASGLCWLFRFSFSFVFIFTYILGFANGLLIMGVITYDE